MRTIFHLDLDAFFVSVERIIDPSLEGKPVIVGGDPHGRGVVAACSYEARAYGLHSAMPIRQAFRLCPHGIYLHGHSGEYSRYSKLVRNILEKYAPVIEQASIDEFYMDFTGCRKLYGHFPDFAERLQSEIWDTLHLPCSIGIASNKTVAKICSDFKKPKGVTYIVPGMEKEFLAPLPIELIPGVGTKSLPVLQSKGFYKIGDVAEAPLDYFTAAFGKPGMDLWHKANGEGTEYLTTERERKSISHERTYNKDVANRQIVEETLFRLTGKVCQSMRDKNVQASTITLKLRYSDFVTVTRSKTVRNHISDDKKVFEIAMALLDNAYTRRVAVRLIGIGVSNLVPFAEQELIFEDEEAKRKRMFEAINQIRGKYGYEMIQLRIANST